MLSTAQVWQPVPMPILLNPENVSIVEIYDVTFPARFGWSWSDDLGTRLAVIDGEPATELAMLVAQLPPGEQKRCFNPRFALRIRQLPDVLTEVVLCFSCNRASYRRAGTAEFFDFDAAAAPSTKLLAELRRIRLGDDGPRDG